MKAITSHQTPRGDISFALEAVFDGIVRYRRNVIGTNDFTSELIRTDNITGAVQFEAFLKTRKSWTERRESVSFKHGSEMASQTDRTRQS
jgi:hypothetical protein